MNSANLCSQIGFIINFDNVSYLANLRRDNGETGGTGATAQNRQDVVVQPKGLLSDMGMGPDRGSLPISGIVPS